MLNNISHVKEVHVLSWKKFTPRLSEIAYPFCGFSYGKWKILKQKSMLSTQFSNCLDPTFRKGGFWLSKKRHMIIVIPRSYVRQKNGFCFSPTRIIMILSVNRMIWQDIKWYFPNPQCQIVQELHEVKKSGHYEKIVKCLS